MKPCQLRPLIGRRVSAYWNGLRTGTVVDAPASDTLTVEFGAYGPHRIDARDVRRVFFHKWLTLNEYLELQKEHA